MLLYFELLERDRRLFAACTATTEDGEADAEDAEDELLDDGLAAAAGAEEVLPKLGGGPKAESSFLADCCEWPAASRPLVLSMQLRASRNICTITVNYCTVSSTTDARSATQRGRHKHTTGAISAGGDGLCYGCVSISSVMRASKM